MVREGEIETTSKIRESSQFLVTHSSFSDISFLGIKSLYVLLLFLFLGILYPASLSHLTLFTHSSFT